MQEREYTVFAAAFRRQEPDSVLMSMWSVLETETQELMNLFGSVESLKHGNTCCRR
jgi:hypothetical protein